MKKVFAALAACAVAVSLFAVAGCGGGNNDNKKHEGAIDGDYTEKTPDEMEDIFGDIIDNVLGGNDSDNNGGASSLIGNYNYGLAVDISTSYSFGPIYSEEMSTKLDFKLKNDNGNFVGAGSVKIDGSSYSTDGVDVETSKSSYEGTAYLKDLVLYAEGDGTIIFSGTEDGEETGETDEPFLDGLLNGKVSINLAEIISALNSDGDISSSPADADVSDSSSTSGWQSYLTVANLLALAKEYSVSYGVELKNGDIKLKLAASEDTIWKAVTQITGETDLTDIKEGVTFNGDPVLEVYIVLDSDNAIKEASVVVDIDVEIDPSLLFGSDEGGYGDNYEKSYKAATAAAAEEEAPAITASISGYIKLYTHNESVSVPEGIEDDETYWDATENILELLGDVFGSDYKEPELSWSENY